MQSAQQIYDRSQADAYDNIAPTAQQGLAAHQYTETDQFFSTEERAAVLKQQITAELPLLQQQLSRVGLTGEFFARHPDIADDLFSGRQTRLVSLYVSADVLVEGRLRIVATEQGPDIRFSPYQPQLTIPQHIAGIELSRSEQEQLARDGQLPRPFLIAQPDGNYLPTYLRVDQQTNAVELWQVKAEQLPTKLLGIDLTRAQQLQLVNGHAVHLSGLQDQRGELFSATVSLSPLNQGLQLANLSRVDLKLTPDNKHREQIALNNEGGKTDLTRSQEQQIGAPLMTNQQREAISQVLNHKPGNHTDSPKLRPS